MSQKRQQEGEGGKAREGGDGMPVDKSKRFRSVVEQVMKLQKTNQLLMSGLEPTLEPLIRRVVREEVELALRKHLSSRRWTCEKDTLVLESSSLQLKFLNNISLPVFTSARIEGDSSPTIRVGLIEPLTGEVITSGPESCAKVEIVVLEGDFDASDWKAEDFKNNIVREREGKKPLLNGDVFLVLKDGIGSMGDISFTDNSSWTRSRKFRLGARTVDHFNSVKIKEATTESFIVRDHRGELYRKHHPPSLLDEVWRLEKIGKDGAFHKRLSQEKINTVEDFLRLFYTNPSKLRHILGSGMSAKMWEVAVEHARTCVLDKMVYLYYPPAFQKKSGVVFNVVAQVMGLLKDCQYLPIDKLSETEKAEAQEMVVAAFDCWGDVMPFGDETSLVEEISRLMNNALFPSSSPRMATSTTSKVLASNNVSGFDYSVGGVSGLDEFTLPNFENTGPIRYDQTSAYPCQVSNPLTPDMEAMTPSISDDYHMRFFNNEIIQSSQNLGLEDSQADLQTAVDGFIYHQHVTAVAVDKAQMRWTKLFSVLKWFSIRKLVARKRTRVRETPERNRLVQG